MIGLARRAIAWRGVSLLITAIALAGCQSLPRDRSDFHVEDQDFGLIAGAALDMVERHHPVDAIVLPASPALDPRAIAALKARKPLHRAADLPGGGDLALPERWLRIERFDIDDGVAQFEVELGPITRAAEGRNVPGCGLRIAMAFFWETKAWASHSYKVLDCAQTRSWTPVDAQ